MRSGSPPAHRDGDLAYVDAFTEAAQDIAPHSTATTAPMSGTPRTTTGILSLNAARHRLFVLQRQRAWSRRRLPSDPRLPGEDGTGRRRSTADGCRCRRAPCSTAPRTGRQSATSVPARAADLLLHRGLAEKLRNRVSINKLIETGCARRVDRDVPQRLDVTSRQRIQSGAMARRSEYVTGPTGFAKGSPHALSQSLCRFDRRCSLRRRGLRRPAMAGLAHPLGQPAARAMPRTTTGTRELKQPGTATPAATAPPAASKAIAARPAPISPTTGSGAR